MRNVAVCQPMVYIYKLEEQLRQKCYREQQLEDELTGMRLQLQRPQTVDNKLRKEYEKTSADELDLRDWEKQEQENADEELVGGKNTADELKSVLEKESQLMDQLTGILRETEEKTDQKQKEFSAEKQQQMSDFLQQKTSSAKDVLHHRWQMVNDLDTLSSQPDVESMTRQQFKRKVVEMVQDKWVPRYQEYVQNGVQALRQEMANACDGNLSSLIEEIGSTVRCNMKMSLKLVDELQNAVEEQRNLREKWKTAATDREVAAAGWKKLILTDNYTHS